MASSPCTLVLSDLALELGVEEGLDGGAGKLQDELDKDDERHQPTPPTSDHDRVTRQSMQAQPNLRAISFKSPRSRTGMVTLTVSR